MCFSSLALAAISEFLPLLRWLDKVDYQWKNNIFFNKKLIYPPPYGLQSSNEITVPFSKTFEECKISHAISIMNWRKSYESPEFSNCIVFLKTKNSFFLYSHLPIELETVPTPVASTDVIFSTIGWPKFTTLFFKMTVKLSLLGISPSTSVNCIWNIQI